MAAYAVGGLALLYFLSKRKQGTTPVAPTTGATSTADPSMGHVWTGPQPSAADLAFFAGLAAEYGYQPVPGYPGVYVLNGQYIGPGAEVTQLQILPKNVFTADSIAQSDQFIGTTGPGAVRVQATWDGKLTTVQKALAAGLGVRFVTSPSIPPGTNWTYCLGSGQFTPVQGDAACAAETGGGLLAVAGTDFFIFGNTRPELVAAIKNVSGLTNVLTGA